MMCPSLVLRLSVYVLRCGARSASFDMHPSLCHIHHACRMMQALTQIDGRVADLELELERLSADGADGLGRG